MKLIVALLGAAVSGAFSFFIFSLVSRCQISQQGYVPSDSDGLIDAFMVVGPLAILVGGWVSSSLYKKRMERRR